MKRLIKIFLLISIIVFGISFFQKEKLPDKSEILESLYQNPIQTETFKKPFNIEREEKTYKITPLYDYELYGLIVSYHHSSDFFDYYHKEWDDYLNEKDICVIWGDNIKTNVYSSMKFKNGSFTCYSKFKTGTKREVWSQFRNDNISNNHLLSNIDEEINKIVMKAKKGDQIYLKGYLAKYASEDGFERGSSISRKDTGNGACETIYLTDFKILKEANQSWRLAYSISKYSIFICLFLLISNFLYRAVK